MTLIEGSAGYCRICGGYSPQLRRKGRCSVLFDLGHVKEARAMMLCPACFTDMERWTHTMCLIHGKRRPMAPEQREKLAAAQRGRKLSEETKQRVSQARRERDNALEPGYQWLTQKDLDKDREVLKQMLFGDKPLPNGTLPSQDKVRNERT